MLLNIYNAKHRGYFMNRELKFRVWAIKARQWITVHSFAIGEYNGIYPFGISPETVIIQQFTGLQDKNGAYIYEGDIIQLDEIIGDVFWDDGSFQIRLNKNQGKNHLIQERAKRFTIIGNIFENPELLKHE